LALAPVLRWAIGFPAAPPRTGLPAAAGLALQHPQKSTPLSLFAYLDAQTGVGEAAECFAGLRRLPVST